MGAGIAGAALVAAFVSACGTHGRAHGTIVFRTFDDGRIAFYGVRPDGTGLARVLPGRVPYETYVAWRRDGAKALLIDGKGGAYVSGARFRVVPEQRYAVVAGRQTAAALDECWQCRRRG
jgi:hypothetical protein